jgi:hypothetical protein
VVVAVTRARTLVLVGLALLGVGWALMPRAALPLYDGVGFPDEPYRFVQPPAGAKHTKAPTTGRDQVGVRRGRNIAELLAASAEQAPQVSVFFPAGLLATPAGTTQVTVVAAPAQALPTAAGQHLWSNVYDITATPAASIRSGALQATITMRAATAQRPEPQIAYYAGGRWTRVPTFAVGRDIYSAQLTRLGRFAVIGAVPLDVSQLAGAKRGSTASIVGIVVGVGALVVLVALFLIGRRRRARAREREEASA